jgi:hypothetical protein
MKKAFISQTIRGIHEKILWEFNERCLNDFPSELEFNFPAIFRKENFYVQKGCAQEEIKLLLDLRY